jgi:ABC-type branched-subunit amino acid transport system substrate-binding protein
LIITDLEADFGHDFLFRTAVSDATQGIVLASMAHDAGYREVSILYIDDAYGRGLMKDMIAPLAQWVFVIICARLQGREEIKASTEDLKRAFELLQAGKPIASGNVDFDENGDVMAPIEIWCYEGGEIVSKELVTPNSAQ